MIHIVLVARWGAKGFFSVRYLFFFLLWLVMPFSQWWWKALTLSLQVVMTWHVACCNQEQVLRPLGGPLVKQRWVNFTLFTLCVSSLAFGVTSGSASFYGWQSDSRHGFWLSRWSKGSLWLCISQRQDISQKFMSCCLDLIPILLGWPRRSLTRGAAGGRGGFASSSSENSLPANVPTCLSVTTSTFLLFIITLITRISAPQKILINIQALVCRPSQSGCDYRQRRRREFNWMSQLISFSKVCKRSSFLFCCWFFIITNCIL